MNKTPDHIPNIGLHNFVELSDVALNKLSESDNEKRKFSISIELEDPRARTPYVQIISQIDISFNGVDSSGDQIDHWVEKTPDNFFKSILVFRNAVLKMR